VIEVACDTVGLGEVLRFDAAGLAEATATLDVLDLNCAEGPTADLTLDGGTEGVTCLSAGAPAMVRADLGGSRAGSAPLVGGYVDSGTGEWSSSVSDIVSLRYDAPGGAAVRAVAFDSAGCASIAEGYVWVGLPDGSPTGPIEVATLTEVAAGGTARVDVRARDCAGAPATGDLLVRVDAGVLALTGSGDGLVLPLDAAGAGSALWTVATSHDGVATFLAGGTVQARGSATLLVSDDRYGPRLVSVTPEGRFTERVASLVLVFDTDVDASTLAGAVHLTDDAGGVVPLDLFLDEDGRTLRGFPDEELDGAAGEWRLVVDSTVTDAHGNFLDGAGDGAVAPYEGWFGVLPEGPATPSCSVLGGSVLVPDGDGSPGADPDTLDVLAVPVGPAPARWRWWVESADGVRVRTEAVDAFTRTWTWNGASDVDRIVAPGAYTVGVQAQDVWGTRSAPCEVGVRLDQAVVPG
jgi:hypothetical protein